MKKYRVYLGACDHYDADRITAILEEAFKQGIEPKPISGKVVIKPNLVMAHPKVATESYTRKEVTEAIIRFINNHGQNVEKIDIVEKSGLGVTTAAMFRNAGYRQLKKKYGVKLCAMEERRRQTVVLQKGKIHHHLSIPKETAQRDFLVFAPKLKTNVLGHSYTGALKLNVGTIDSKERMSHHNCDLPAKIVDILEIANPDYIVTDGIRFSFGGSQLTQHGTDLGVVVVSTNAVAHDMVCAKMINLDPDKIEHIREAADRGYGPTSFDEIEILGDFPIEKAQQTCANLDYGFMPVDRFPCNFNIQVGVPYCTGGCQGVFLDWLHMVKDRKPKLIKKFPALGVLIGKVEKPQDTPKVLLFGDCALASGPLKARKIVRIKGCPPSHKRLVWDMMVYFRLIAPLVRISLIIDGFVLYPWKKIKGWFANLGA